MATANNKTNEPVTETKADKFRRLGNARTNKALDAIKSIKGLANKNSYEYTAEQTNAIVKALETALDEVKDAFAGRLSGNGGFTL